MSQEQTIRFLCGLLVLFVILFGFSHFDAWASSSSYWVPTGIGLPANRDVLALAFTSTETLFAGISSTATDRGIYRSTNGGNNWTHISPPTSSVQCLAVDPTNPNKLFAGTSDIRVFSSSNGGLSWTQFGSPLSSAVFALAINPTNTAILFAGTDGGGIFKFIGSGGTYRNTGLPPSCRVRSLAINPTNPDNLFLGWVGGVCRTFDGGANWSQVSGLPSAPVWALAIDPTTPSTVYAGIVSNGVWKSTNGGESWVTTTLTKPSVYSLALDPKNSATLLAGTEFNQGNVWRSTDRGESWTLDATGLDNRAVRSLCFNPADPATVYAGLGAGSIFKRIELALEKPITSEDWPIGTLQEVRWSTNVSGDVRIALSRGGTFTDTEWIGTVSASACSFPWLVSGPSAPNCRVKVTSASVPALIAFSETPFSISTPTISLSAPQGGERWPLGSVQTIRWTTAHLLGTFLVELSRNGSFTDTEILASSISEGSSQFEWTVSGPVSSSCRVRVSSQSLPSIQSVSDHSFAIVSPTLVLLSPQGGEHWALGEIQSVAWSSSDVSGLLTVYLARDGLHFNEVLWNGSVAVDHCTWTATGPGTINARVKVTSDQPIPLEDASLGYLTIAERASITSSGPFQLSLPAVGVEVIGEHSGTATFWATPLQTTLTHEPPCSSFLMSTGKRAVCFFDLSQEGFQGELMVKLQYPCQLGEESFQLLRWDGLAWQQQPGILEEETHTFLFSIDASALWGTPFALAGDPKAMPSFNERSMWITTACLLWLGVIFLWRQKNRSQKTD